MAAKCLVKRRSDLVRYAEEAYTRSVPATEMRLRTRWLSEGVRGSPVLQKSGGVWNPIAARRYPPRGVRRAFASEANRSRNTPGRNRCIDT